MALNFPASPTIGDQFTDGTTIWQWDGTSWNVVAGAAAVPDTFTTFNADTGTTTANQENDILTVSGGTDISTSITGDVVTINFTGTTGDPDQNVFTTFNADIGSIVASSTSDSVTFVGGVGLDSQASGANLTFNLNASINNLSDVDTVSNPPTTGQVLKWDGAKWAPGLDVAQGGAGLDADTLDGFDGSYYLNYNNHSNTPTIPSDVGDLTDTGNLIPNPPAIEDSLGTPTLATGITAAEVRTAIGAGTSNFGGAFADLSGKPTTIAGYGITDAVEDFADLGNKPTTIAGYGITDALSTTSNLSDLNDVAATVPATGQALIWDGSAWGPDTVSGGGGDPDQNIFQSVLGDAGIITAASTTDQFTIVGGSNISTTANGTNKTVTVNFTGTLGVTKFDDLEEVQRTGGRTIDKIYMPAFAMLRLTNNGNTAYTCASHGYTGNNPTFYAIGGMTIAFDLDQIGGHPFEIQDGTGTPYNTGLTHVDVIGNVSTGSNAQGKDGGTLYWEVPETISGNYRYQCTLHAAMVGPITIKRISVI